METTGKKLTKALDRVWEQLKADKKAATDAIDHDKANAYGLMQELVMRISWAVEDEFDHPSD